MRTLGPGSVSSLLKTVLDVAYVLLWIVGVVLAFSTLLLLVSAPFAPRLLGGIEQVRIEGVEVQDLSRIVLLAAGVLFGVWLYTVGLIAIVGRLRRIFATLIVGDPFQPENARRLQVVGVSLAGLLLLGSLLIPGAAMLFAPEFAADIGQFSFNPTSWFAVLIVFVLAEVFREGTRLRHEAGLTI